MCKPPHLSAEMTDNAPAGDLTEHAPLDEPGQKLGSPLEQFEALRVGQHRGQPLYLEPKQHVLHVVGMPEEW